MGRRPREHPKVTVWFRIEQSDKAALDHLARLTGREVSEMGREALRLYVIDQLMAVRRAERQFERQLDEIHKAQEREREARWRRNNTGS